MLKFVIAAILCLILFFFGLPKIVNTIKKGNQQEEGGTDYWTKENHGTGGIDENFYGAYQHNEYIPANKNPEYFLSKIKNKGDHHSVPIDGGLEFLALAGVIYVFNEYRKHLGKHTKILHLDCPK